MTDSGFDLLNDEIALQVLASGLDLQDLLRFGRVSRRARALVHSATAAWKQLYAQTFGSLPKHQQSHLGIERLYKERYLKSIRAAAEL